MRRQRRRERVRIVPCVRTIVVCRTGTIVGVARLNRIVTIGFLAGCLFGQASDRDAYAIYSTVLQTAHGDIAHWIIVNKTHSFDLCLTPAHDQEAIYRSMVDDYKAKNRSEVGLEPMFALANYAMGGPEEWARTPSRRNVAVFSGVGFSADGTRAAVCYWAASNGTCSVLVRSGGNWLLDEGWRGDGCGWAF